jgi:hypothetical protein
MEQLTSIIKSLLNDIANNVVVISIVTMLALGITFVIGLASAPHKPTISPAVSASQLVVKVMILAVLALLLLVWYRYCAATR